MTEKATVSSFLLSMTSSGVVSTSLADGEATEGLRRSNQEPSYSGAVSASSAAVKATEGPNKSHKEFGISQQGKNSPLTQKELLGLASVFLAFAILLSSIYYTMPEVDYNELKLPRTVGELRTLREYLATYTQEYTSHVLLGYIAIYVFMQTFMIPGTFVMSLLAGSLFGVIPGLILVVATATAGASACYFLSMKIGRPIAFWLWPDKLKFFCDEVAKRKSRLLNYMLFLRITPTLPNTFINVSSPIVGIPFATFFLATVVGLIPAAFVTVRAGLALGELNSFSDLYDLKTLATLFFIGIVSIFPALLGQKVEENT